MKENGKHNPYLSSLDAHRFHQCRFDVTETTPEIERARENLAQGGKTYGGPFRRDSMPMMGGARSFSEFGGLWSGLLPHGKSNLTIKTLA